MADPLPASGHIDPKTFPFTLVDFYRQGATGSLKVAGDNHQKALYFRAGRVLFGSSNDPKDQLGAILIESGKITEQQLEDVNQKVGPGNPLAKVLSDSGVVSQRELSEAARAKVERIVSDVLAYSEGSFEFEDGVLPKGAVDLKLSPDRLFLAAVRRISDRAFVLRHIDGLGVMFTTRPELQEKLLEIESEIGGLPEHFDGLTSLKDAAGRAALDEFEAAKIACGLLFLGLVEKSAAIVVGGDEAAPMFSGESTELDLGQGAQPSIVPDEPTLTMNADELQIPASSSEPAPEPPPPPPPADADATLVMGEVPSFTLPKLSSPPAPPPVVAAAKAPEPPAAAPGAPPPLKIIAPPKAAERTRPPQKPSKDDLAALDELLGKRSPEGPLTPIQKPADEWKPSFLPERTTRGRREPPAADRRKLFMGVGGAVAAAVLAAGGWMLWSNRATGGTKTAAVASSHPSAVPSPSPSIAAPPSASPVVSASPSAAPSPSAAAPSAKPSAAPSAKATPAPTPVPSPTKAAVAAPTTPAPKPTPTPAPTSAPKATATGGLAGARAALRGGRFDDAARGFQAHLKDSKASHSVQVLLSCSTENLQKAVSNNPDDELFILPTRNNGRDCYRVGWGIYDGAAAAEAALKKVPAYFTAGKNKPKVLALTEMSR